MKYRVIQSSNLERCVQELNDNPNLTLLHFSLRGIEGGKGAIALVGAPSDGEPILSEDNSKEIEQYKEQIENTLTMADELKQNLEKCLEEKEQYIKENADLNKEKEKLNADIEDLGKQNETLAEDNANLEKLNKALDAKAKGLEKKLKKLIEA